MGGNGRTVAGKQEHVCGGSRRRAQRRVPDDARAKSLLVIAADYQTRFATREKQNVGIGKRH